MIVKVPFNQSPPIRPFQARSQPIDRVFQAASESNDSDCVVKDCFYAPPAEGELLSRTLTQNTERYQRLLQKEVSAGHLTPCDAQSKQQAFEAGKLGPQGQPCNNAKLQELENEQFLLTRFSQQTADGLYRTQDYYLAPGTLHLRTIAQGWETSVDTDGQELPVADVVVIGAGPGGLTSAWQLARRGARVITFESEIAGSAFSDAGAKAVHSMRTSADATNLVQEGHGRATLEHSFSLHGNLGPYRRLALAGHEAQSEMTGMPQHGVPDESKDTSRRSAPAMRSELFEHLAQMSHSLASDFPDAFLCERSPVSQVTYEDGLFTISSSRGHKVKAKEVVLATGLTGPRGEKARLLPQFQALDQDELLCLNSEADLFANSEQLTKLALDQERKPMVICDRLLGQQSLRQTLARFEEGSRVAVVGGGESAIKAALEVLHLNPGVSVDIFAKERIEAAQTQIPNENFHPVVLEQMTDGPEAIESAWARAELFGVPVTPRSLKELLHFQKEGRVQLLEMGAYFEPATVQATLSQEGNLNLQIKNSDVQETLNQAHAELEAKGLLPSQSLPYQGNEYRALIQSVGYKKQSFQEHPLSHLPAEALDKVHMNTAGLPHHPVETSLAGLSIRGRKLAEELSQEIPQERRVEITVPQKGVDWRKASPTLAKGVIENRGVQPRFANRVRKALAETGSHPNVSHILLPSTDRELRRLYSKREEGTITAVELEVLERALSLSARMGPNSLAPHKP